MKKMKAVSILVLITVVRLNACYAQTMQTVFESAEKDSATEPDTLKIYQLKKQVINADFNYSKLEDIDGHKMDTLNIRNLMPVFEPVPGQFNYYQFVATYRGAGYNFGEPAIIEDFHDILIIKTDKASKITDSYHYTLEWAEPPLQYDVFKSTATGTKLSNGLDISKLKLRRTTYRNKNNRELKEKGIIKLNKN